MRLSLLLGAAALAMTSVLAVAQNAPESLLPPGFDDPAPAAAPAPAPSRGGQAQTGSSPVVQAVPGASSPDTAPAPDPALLAKLPSLEELEEMTPEELEEALGIAPKFDIPPAARRATNQIGIIDESEGGFAPDLLERQNASLVRALLTGNRGKLVSRWGHIMLRRVLASRLDTPRRMKPADFAALRASLLLRMNEPEAARGLVQDIDSGNYSPLLVNAAFDSYVETQDFTGICPVMMTRGTLRSDPKWEASSAICGAFRGDGASAMSRLDRAMSRGDMSRIDVLLAQRYAGAAGRVRRAVNIEWEGVESLAPWSYGLAAAVGLEPPANLTEAFGERHYGSIALAPALGLEKRAEGADRAGAAGVLSSSAMIDLYSQIYSDESIEGDWADRAGKLRDAYVQSDPSARLLAMQELWSGADGGHERYSRKVLTAFAAARMPVDTDLRDNAGELIESMLTAGLDRNALRWAGQVEAGSQAWALLALAAPNRGSPVDQGTIELFIDDDDSAEARKSAFLVAGLAGLGRIAPQTRSALSQRLELNLERQSRWTRMIGTAAERGNPAMVALLAALGMQGPSWDKMTPRYLYNIVASLKRAGLEAEARMIAAEAVARA